MTDLETRLADHFARRTSDLPSTGPGLDLDAPGAFGSEPLGRTRSAAVLMIAASCVLLLGVGGLFLLGRSGGDSVSTAETEPSQIGESAVAEMSTLEPVETLPDGDAVSGSPVTVARTSQLSWYGFAPDLDIAWFQDAADDITPSMFCWRTSAVLEPQCFVDPLGALIVPLVVPTAGGQTLVLAGGDESDPVLTVTLDDGTELQSSQDFDDTIDWGVGRYLVPDGRSIVTVGGDPVVPPSTLENYVPPILLGLVGLDLVDFEERAAEFGFETRVVEADGVGINVNFDRRNNRINVVTVDGLVTDLLPVG